MINFLEVKYGEITKFDSKYYEKIQSFLQSFAPTWDSLGSTFLGGQLIKTNKTCTTIFKEMNVRLVKAKAVA